MTRFQPALPRLVSAEDNFDFSLALSEYFSLAGYDVVTIKHVSSLISYSTSYPDIPHIFVLDRFLEDGNIDQALEKISAIPNSRFLILTAYPSFDSSVSALRNRAVEYLVKPVMLRDLEKKLVNIWKEMSPFSFRPIHHDHEWDALIRTYLLAYPVNADTPYM